MDRPKSQPVTAPQGRRAKSAEASDKDKAAEIGQHIGRELRTMFDDVVKEPVPEKFRQLLEELEKKQSKG